MTSAAPAHSFVWQAYAEVVALAHDTSTLTWRVDLATLLASAILVAAITLLLAKGRPATRTAARRREAPAPEPVDPGAATR